MQSNKRNCVKLNDNIQESRAVKKQSLIEQALSNALIVGNILEFLSPQDIIRVSLVNRDWCVYSRECLRKKSKKYPVCAQITHDNPCRALADFNNFLQTITGRGDNNQDTIIFNGIHQAYQDPNLKIIHPDCLIKDWKRGDEPLPPAELTAKIRETFGKVLEKIKFRFIRSIDEIPISCPFAMFIKLIICERAEEIMELDFGSRHNRFGDFKDVVYYLKDGIQEPRLFPNLEVFGTDWIENDRKLPIRAPVLKTLNHYWIQIEASPLGIIPNQSRFDFSFNVITQVTIDSSQVQTLIDFIQKFRPSLQFLGFRCGGRRGGQPHAWLCQDARYQQKHFTLGQLTSSTLTRLDCTISDFVFMAGRGFFPRDKDEPEAMNAFPSLKKLNLTGWMEVDLIDCFSWLDFPRNFPQLQTVTLTLAPPCTWKNNPVNGPSNYFHGSACKTVSTLALDQLERDLHEHEFSSFQPGITPIPGLLRLFANIRHLDLTEMTLRCDPADRTFADIINELGNLPFLEELNIQPVSLTLLRLDHIFLQDEELSEFQRMFEEAGKERILVYKSSLLHHKRLRRISIHGSSICGRFMECYSDQTPGYFIVSSHTARIICRYKPGFQFSLHTSHCDSARVCECNNYVGPSGLRFEHLEPYTTISLTQRRADDVRVFTFLDLLCSSENESSAVQSNKCHCAGSNDNSQESHGIEKHIEKHMKEHMEKHTEKHIEKSAVDLVFSNALILRNILEVLSPQDIIRVSLVSKDWCANSRECLRKKSNKYPVCAQITHDNPCRALADFNNFLQTITGRGENNQDTIIFNGIHQSYPDRNLKTHTNCLGNDWVNGYKPIPMEELTRKIQEIYGNILKKVKFRFIYILDEIPVSCPFAMLIKFVISERAEEILELDFGHLTTFVKVYEDIRYDLLGKNFKPKVFPNLEVFGTTIIKQNEKMPILAPALKALKHVKFEFKTCSSIVMPNQSDFDFKLNVITYVQNPHNLDAVENLVDFIQVFRPRLQRLQYDHNRYRLEHAEVHQDVEHCQTLFTLGKLTSLTLTHLECTITTFAFMAGRGFFCPADDDEPEIENAFPSLKKLDLIGWMEVDLMDLFSGLDLPKNFPQLKKVVLDLVPPKEENPVNGPYNHVHSCIWTTVSTLVLKISDEHRFKYYTASFKYFEPEVTPIPRVLGMFANIRHLDLRKMSLKCDHTDRTFADIINELENLPYLEELSIRPTFLTHLRLDHIFLQKDQLPGFNRKLGNTRMEQILIFKSSLLYHKQLKRITIHRDMMGLCRMLNLDMHCYSDQTPGYFMVSSQTAKAICMYRPGFQFCLQTRRCKPECCNYVGTAGLQIEHLEPYTTISLTERRTDDVRVFKFLDLSN